MRRPPRAGLLFCLGVLAFPLCFQGTRGLLEPDEGRYAEVAREMLATGDWLVPRLAGRPHFTKPPLAYWCTAAGLAVGGRNAWGARLPLGLAAGATALLCGLISRRFWGSAALRTGTALFLLAFAPFASAAILTADMFLTLWVTAGVLCALEAWTGGPRHRLWAAGAGVAFGLAFLTKGPPGLLPLAATGLFAAWRGAGRRGRLWSLPGLAAGLGIGLTWYALVVAGTPGLGRYFLGDEVYARLFTAEHHRENSWLMHPATLVVGFLPWTVALPFLTGGWRATGRRLAARLRRPGDDRVRFLLVWFAAPLAVFLVVRSRLPLYLLPLFVPLSVAAAGLLHGGVGATAGHWPGPSLPAGGALPPARPALPGRRFWRFAALWSGALLALKAAAGLAIPWPQDMRALDRTLGALAPGGARVIAVGVHPLHGLRFYRNGDLTNWREGPPAPGQEDGDRLSAGIAAERAAAARDRQPRLLVLDADARWADGDLAAAGLAPAMMARGRVFYLVEPADPGPPRPAAAH